jgi:hypothetical protein
VASGNMDQTLMMIKPVFVAINISNRFEILLINNGKFIQDGEKLDTSVPS